jgi:hypothetical protein
MPKERVAGKGKARSVAKLRRDACFALPPGLASRRWPALIQQRCERSCSPADVSRHRSATLTGRLTHSQTRVLWKYRVQEGSSPALRKGAIVDLLSRLVD